MMIIFLSKHDWDSYQALQQKQRVVYNAKAVQHVLVAQAGEVAEEQDMMKCGEDQYSRPACNGSPPSLFATALPLPP